MVMREKRGLLSIREVAEITALPIHTLRYWERMFREVMCPSRTKGGQRRYGVGDIEKLLEIKRLLKEEGYSIMGAQRLLKNGIDKAVLPHSHQVRDLNLQRIAQEVTELILEKLSQGIGRGIHHPSNDAAI
jgi:DNA-binding transcriptional MerR regulator